MTVCSPPHAWLRKSQSGCACSKQTSMLLKTSRSTPIRRLNFSWTFHQINLKSLDFSRRLLLVNLGKEHGIFYHLDSSYYLFGLGILFLPQPSRWQKSAYLCVTSCHLSGFKIGKFCSNHRRLKPHEFNLDFWGLAHHFIKALCFIFSTWAWQTFCLSSCVLLSFAIHRQ